MKRIPITLCLLLLLPGCAVQKSSRPTFAVCMTGPRVWTLGLEYWPVFENGCHVCNFLTDHQICLRDFSLYQNHYELFMNKGGSGDDD